jgi:hypothetical protein
MVKVTQNITAISVVYNTPELILTAISSIQRFYPDLKFFIVNGSDRDSECTKILNRVVDENISIHHVGHNIGHGKGMHYALQIIETEFALIFDSDIVMKKQGILEAMDLRVIGKYGVGEIVKTNDEGINKPDGQISYLHPYFMLLDVDMYFKEPEFVHHGAPCYRAMNAISKSNRQHILVDFPVEEYVLHHGKGTRNLFGFKRIGWE